MSEPLKPEALEAARVELPGWTVDENALSKTFELKDFREAVGFIVRLAFEAESLNHHPELQNVYNRVVVRLTTHDAGNRVTTKDLELARAIERLYGK
jgi:4a-hydroxytetrahydrobiopterin dehydratase